MAEYKWAGKNGGITIAEYSKDMVLSNSEIQREIKNAFNSLGNDVNIEPVSDSLVEVYKVVIPSHGKNINVYVCAKGTTPGGRNSLKDEQRIQQKAKYLNFVYEKQMNGEKAISLGIYKKDNEIVFCAWKLMKSNAASSETPISKQIKITTIAKAITEGFVQQDKGNREYACAFRKEFIYFYLNNCEWLHAGKVSELAEHTLPESEEMLNVAKKDFSVNRIVFGAPGTGKSFGLNEDSKCFGENVERITFHPNYTYAQFVGTYKPVMEYEGNTKTISYDYIPGPFIRTYVKAHRAMLHNICINEYKNTADTNYFFEPATDMSNWNLFEIIQEVGQMETFRATKDMRNGDVAFVYIGNNNYGYRPGVYAIARIISDPIQDPDEGTLIVWLRFDKISYNNPIIEKEEFLNYTTQIRSVHMLEFGKSLIEQIDFSEDIKDYLLLLEEINRANVAAVFGDVFQLLDRKAGVSEYPIDTSEDVRKYLEAELEGYEFDCKKMWIPSNLYIWATMNSADQGVYPIDTAFKRRWDFEYIGINDARDKVTEYLIPVGMGTTRKYVSWDELRTGINNILIEEGRINEDKLLGPFFMSKDALENAMNDEGKENIFVKAFQSKVIMYLFEDVMKMKPQLIFKGHANKNGKMIYSEICKAFEKEGEKIFGFELQSMDRGE